ncbi:MULTISPECIES: DUF551 domain-containing protein [Mixta]|uniref:DUF551 domain-containing protein n=1 Tax=Mixta hanseatica TaxID=2872648 RepID=A0ABY4RE22_9GAMM|nr:DUF551 domain-containing protein [Mixta hanseatica]
MEWIKYSDRVPEEGQSCVIYTTDGQYITARYDEEQGIFYDLDWSDPYLYAIAWTPLMECPY